MFSSRISSAAPVVLFAAGIILTVRLAQSIAGERYRDVLLAVALAQIAWIGVRWRVSVYLFMVYVAAEGFVINFFHSIPELNLLKDVFAVCLFAALALVLVLKRESLFFPALPWVVAFAAFSGVYILQVFNPALPNLLVGLVGVRTTMLFFVLAPVAYWFFDSRERVFEFFEFMTWLSVPVALFGIVQSWLGPGWVVSLSPGFSRAVYYAVGSRGLTEASYFRTFSTFVHTGGFALFLSFMLLVTVALWILPAWRSRRLILAGVFVLQFWAFLSTGGRGAFVILILSMGILLVTNPVARRFLPLVLAIPAVFFASAYVTGRGFQERYETLLDFDYLVQRNAPLVGGWLAESMKSDWVGLGAGYASVASRHVGVTPLNANVVENGLAKIRFEAGLPGLVLYVIFLLCIQMECFLGPRRIRDPEIRWLVTVCAIFVAFNTGLVFAGTPFDITPTNTYLWFFLGLMARASRLVPVPQRVAVQP
jgi:hypothetical protein